MAVEGEKSPEERRKEKVHRGICTSYFCSVVAHTTCIQSDAIILRNACGQDLSKTARVAAITNALAAVIGLFMNQIGGKLSDSVGRKPFHLVGPIVQILAGLACFAKPKNLALLCVAKMLRLIATTFSGTLMGGVALTDTFEGRELGIKNAKASSFVGMAIMTGPLIEATVLKKAKAGREHFSYVALAATGLLSGIANNFMIPETLSLEKRRKFDSSSALRDANPFNFVKLFTQGSYGTKICSSVIILQMMSDGKNMSDLVQIWVREHLKLRMESIRNYQLLYGFSSIISGAAVCPSLIKQMSAYGFTTFTNFTNFLGYLVRGSAENAWLFFGTMPLMLPGINANSSMAIGPVNTGHVLADGFGIGEATAWFNNIRVLGGAFATLAYGYFYAWCRKIGINPGLTFALAGLLSAAVPQAVLMVSDRSRLRIDDRPS